MGQRKEPTPSVSSASSEVSSASTSSIHKRSTPKIAAIIIVAFLVIASLAGVTVYFIISEKLLMNKSQTRTVEKRIDEYNYREEIIPDYSTHDYYTTSSETSTTLQDKEVEEEDLTAPEIEKFLQQPPYVQQQSGYIQQPQQSGSYYTGRVGLPTPVFNLDVRRKQPGPRFRNEMLLPKRFRDGKDPEGPPYLQYEQVVPTRESNALIGGLLTVDENRADIPSITERTDSDPDFLEVEGIGLFGDDFSKKIQDEITSEKINQFPTENSDDVQQRFFESGMKADNPNFMRSHPNLRRRFRPRPPYMRARGPNFSSRPVQENLFVTDDENPDLPETGKVATLATLDRRPNRPSFHHLGPPPGSHMRGPPYLRPNQQQPQLNTQSPPQISRRMGGLVENFQEMITLAKSEVGILRELARNITDSGKELNLWEVLDAVNATVSDNPNSGIGRLMQRFYANYLADENEPQLNDTPNPDTYEKSLSSLIFLSFGIFLLNSVNDRITQSAFNNQARSLDSASKQDLEVLQKVMSDHEMLSKLFRSDLLDQPAGSTMTINNYLRLLLNLMNIYSSENSSRDVDCVWSLYCHQLNAQAHLQGMAATVAKINSVGMKLVLEEIPANAALPAVFRSMVSWKDLQCNQMFPKCVQ